MSMLPILFTAAGIVTLALIALAMCRAGGDADEADEKLLRHLSYGDWPHVPRDIDHSGLVQPGLDFYTMPDGTVHPSAGVSVAGDSRGAALSRNGGAPVSDLLHDNGNSRRRPQDHA